MSWLIQVLTNANAINADQSLAQKFYEAYKDDKEMESVDVIFCGHPASICEIYLPFNKSVIVLPSTRLKDVLIQAIYANFFFLAFCLNISNLFLI